MTPLTVDRYRENCEILRENHGNIDEFQQWMRSKPLPTGKNLGRLPLLTMGLGGEAGEAIELLKKHMRDDTPIDLPHLILELGDVMIIVSLIAEHFGVPMSHVLKAAKGKIEGRIARGTLRGSGDDR